MSGIPSVFDSSNTKMSTFTSPGSVERSVAKSEIETLLHRYAVLAKDSAPFDEMAKLFTSDGKFVLPNGVTVEPARMIEVVRGNEPKFVRHHITSIDIKFISETLAHAESYYFAVTDLSSLDHYGSWKDIVKREGSDGQWLIAEKRVGVDGGDEKGWFKANYP